MAIALDAWIARLASLKTDGAVKFVLISGDETREWDTFFLDEDKDVREQASEIARQANEVVKALGPELAKRRHTFLLQAKAVGDRHLGQQTISVMGTSSDNNLHASAHDSLAAAYGAVAQLWKLSLEVVGTQLGQSGEHIASLHAEIISMTNAEIERKKTESDNTVVSSEQVGKLVGLLEEQLPVALEIVRHHASKGK